MPWDCAMLRWNEPIFSKPLYKISILCSLLEILILVVTYFDRS